MPIFNWEGPTYCGDAPATVCDPLETAEIVKAPHGTSLAGGCPVDLISPDHPAIMVSLSDVQTELRSGASDRPIPLDRVQKSISMSANSLLFRNASGQLTVWEPDANCFDKRLIYDAGQFKLIDDVNSNVFDQSCIGSFADAEYIVGARKFTACDGTEKMKLIFFPVAELPTTS
jgi:hypothetical protein